MQIDEFQQSLLKWYLKHARKLPWRETKDPYKIWVSEIMLQQTQVKTVIDYYLKWVETFPNIERLAKAPLSKVLKSWAGLGYYRRARMLHAGAKEVVKNYEGQVPNTVDELLKLPGIGRYTAGAIASIAFEKRAPVLDGNVIRLLTRIFAVSKDITLTNTQKELWALAEKILPAKKVGNFNQALMELGATVCVPTSPRCFVCPVNSFCKAHKVGRETCYPLRKKRTRLEKLANCAMILKQDEKVLIEKQPENDRWGGLWMFPFWQDKKEMLKFVRGKERKIKHLLTIKHGYTKYLITLDVYGAPADDQHIFNVREKEAKWVTPKQLIKHPLPSHHKKIAKTLLGKT